MNPYQIKGRDIKKRNVGTIEKPHLYAITAWGKVKGNRMNPRSKETLAREEKIRSIMFDFDQQTENEKFFNLPDYYAKFGTANPNLELIVSSDANNTLHITMEETFYGELLSTLDPERLEPESLETVTVPKTGNLLRVMLINKSVNPILRLSRNFLPFIC